MKTPLFILLQATGGIRNEVNTFLSDYALYIPYDLLVIFLYIRGQYGMHDRKRIFLVLVHFKPQMKVPHVGMCRTPHELARFQAGKEIRVVYFLFLRGNCTAAVLPSPAASGGL